MTFSKNEQKLFDEAFSVYKNIISFVKSVYIDGNGNVLSICEGNVSMDKALALTDLYLQSLLFKTVSAGVNISEEKILFITELPENRDLVNEVYPDYKKTLKSLGTKKFEEYKDKFLSVSNDIPVFLLLSVSIKEYKSSNVPLYLIESVEKICNCFITLDEVNTVNESLVIENEITRLTNFIKERGIVKEISDKEIRKGHKNNDVTKDTLNLDELLTELNELIGLQSVKSDVNSMINFIRANNLRKEKGLKTIPVSNHMVFTGNPGTGKTTIARLLAKVYKEIGVVSKGQLIETDRAGLVAGYVGQTALKVEDAVKKALGGILFIDEAYNLAEGSNNDFGKEAIAALVKMMEDNRDDLIVIVAGYTEKMDEFISTNPGLSSRFNKSIYFPDYTSDELLEIFKYFCRKSGFLVSESALKLTYDIFKEQHDNSDFGNARGVRNYFDKAVINQANRIIKIKNVSNFELQTIEKEDLINIEVIKKENRKRKIGF